jgi:lipoate-protein ligase A
VVLAGRKLVGSAQVRLGKSLLQHGSVILRGDQDRLDRIRGEEKASPARPATVSEILEAASWSDIAGAVADGLKLALGGTWTQGEYTAAEVERARLLVVERYATEEWTWRR